MALPSFVRHILGAASFPRTKGQDEPAVPRGNDPVRGKPDRTVIPPIDAVLPNLLNLPNLPK